MRLAFPRPVALSLALLAAACASGTPAPTAASKAPTRVTATKKPTPAPTDADAATPTPPAANATPTASPGTVATSSPGPSPTASATASPTPSASATASPTAAPSADATASAAASPTPRPSMVTTVAGDPVHPSFADGTGASADGTDAGQALFNQPVGLAFDPAGHLLVADSLNHRIRKLSFDAAGRATVSTLAGAGTPGLADNVDPLQATFKTPYGLAVDASGNVFVADTGNHLIREIAANGAVTTVAGSVSTGGVGLNGFTEGAGNVSKFNVPQGIAVDGTTLYVADSENNVIRKIDLASPAHTTSVFAGDTAGGGGLLDGVGPAARFLVPYGLALAPDHSLYVAENLTSRVRRVDAQAAVTIFAGPPATLTQGAVGFAEGLATNAKFNFFTSGGGVTVGPDGAIYVADASNERVRVIKGGTVSTLAGDGTLSDPANRIGAYANGPASAAKFNTPLAIAVAADGTVYVADRDNNCIRRIKK